MHARQAIRALRCPDQRGMGRAVTPETGIMDVDRIDAIEAVTVAISAWNPLVIPGLLQTSRYAAGAIALARPALPVEAVERLTRQRMARAAAFLRRMQEVPHFSAWFILGETAITQPLANAHAHADQIRHILDLASMDHLTVQVLPTDRPTPGRMGQFALYKLAPDADDEWSTRLAYLETPVGGWYTQRVEDIARLHSAFCDMMNAAMTSRDSLTYLKEEHAKWMMIAPDRMLSSPDPATATPETASRWRGLPPGR